MIYRQATLPRLATLERAMLGNVVNQWTVTVVAAILLGLAAAVFVWIATGER